MRSGAKDVGWYRGMECSWKTVLLLVCASLVVQYITIRSFRERSLPSSCQGSSHCLERQSKESRWRSACDEGSVPAGTAAMAGTGAVPGRRHILLFTATRCGSSFAGQLLNQHPGIFYIYEPLYHVWQSFTNVTCCLRKTPDQRELLGTYRDLLLNLYTCQLSFLESYIHPQPQDHMTGALFRRSSSNALCSPPVCPAGAAESLAGKPPEAWCDAKCSALNLTLASEACLQRGHVAIKAVRVPQVGDLRTLSEDPRLDLRIVHLVRDPRAILISRMSVFGGYRGWRIWNVTGRQPRYVDLAKIGRTCRDMQASVETALQRPAWLRGRYLLLRYEDLAHSPRSKAQAVFNFLGLDMDPRVLSWITHNTNVNSELRSMYSTRRDSKATAESWRLRLNFKIVQAVQSVCNDTLALLGYKQVHTLEELRNLSYSLVEDGTFPPDL